MSFNILLVLVALFAEVRTDVRLAEAAKNGDIAAVPPDMPEPIGIRAASPKGSMPTSSRWLAIHYVTLTCCGIPPS